MQGQFTFVATDEQGKARKDDMGLIRSHCMRGKNKRESSRRSRRQAKRDALKVLVENEEESNARKDFPASLLATPETGLAVAHFATRVDDSTRRILFKFLAYSAHSNLLYPIENHLAFHKTNDYLSSISYNTASLHSVLLTVCSIDDFVTQQKNPSALTRYHLRNTLNFLNLKLCEEQSYEPDSVILIILTLGTNAAMFEDYGATSVHLKGLQQVVKLRGGQAWLQRFAKFHFKFDRLDLTWCLSTGQPPLFFPTPVSLSPFFRDAHKTPHTTLDSTQYQMIGSSSDYLPPTSSPHLMNIYTDLHKLTTLINEKHATKTQTPINIFQSAIHSIQSRLLALQNTLNDPFSEILRLGMLACLTTTFRVPGRKMPYKYLSRSLCTTFQQVQPFTTEERSFIFWALMMSLVAVFEPNEPWIQDMWCTLVEDDLGWEGAREMLKGTIWLDCVHDEPGQVIFMRCKARRSRYLLGALEV